MPTPSGQTFHYGEHQTPEWGGPRILYRDDAGQYYTRDLSGRALGGGLLDTVEGTLRGAWNNVSGWARRYPVATSLVVLGAGYLLARGISRYT